MWDRENEEYPKDSPFKQQKVQSGQGIVGCEMHETYGWQLSLHRPRTRPKGVLTSLAALFKKGRRKGS